MKDDRQDILNKNYFLNKIKDGRKKDKFHDDKVRTFFITFFISLIVIVGLYAISPYSKTYKVVVNGNYYIKEEDVITSANLNKYYLLTLPEIKAKELEKNPFIKSATIDMLEGNIVSINIEEEKLIGYIYEDNEYKLFLIDDTRVLLDKENMYMIEKVPLIEGYTNEELKSVEKGFEDVDPEIINEISEIHKYPASYDNKQMEVIMRDGNYVFMSSSGLKLLDSYYSISSSFDHNKGYVCLYMDDLTNSAYASSCPWQVNDEVIEEDTNID